MREPPIKEDEETEGLHFRGGWKGLYIFVLAYGVLQIVLLLLFTYTFNRP